MFRFIKPNPSPFTSDLYIDTVKTQQTMLFKQLGSPALRATMARRSMSAAELQKWKAGSFYGVPIAVALVSIFVYRREKAHWAHYERPEFVEYPWLNKRTRPFPWDPTGKKTLFHNDQLNAIPGVGYLADYPNPKH